MSFLFACAVSPRPMRVGGVKAGVEDCFSFSASVILLALGCSSREGMIAVIVHFVSNRDQILEPRFLRNRDFPDWLPILLSRPATTKSHKLTTVAKNTLLRDFLAIAGYIIFVSRVSFLFACAVSPRPKRWGCQCWSGRPSVGKLEFVCGTVLNLNMWKAFLVRGRPRI